MAQTPTSTCGLLTRISSDEISFINVLHFSANAELSLHFKTNRFYEIEGKCPNGKSVLTCKSSFVKCYELTWTITLTFSKHQFSHPFIKTSFAANHIFSPDCFIMCQSTKILNAVQHTWFKLVHRAALTRPALSGILNERYLNYKANSENCVVILFTLTLLLSLKFIFHMQTY